MGSGRTRRTAHTPAHLLASTHATAVFVLAVVVAGMLVSCGAEPAARGIAFTSDRDGHLAVYTMFPDGTGQRRLSSADHPAQAPAVSPDGRRVAFSSARGGNEDIYVVNADGTHERRLTADPALESSPTWSPDGKRLAFARTGARGDDIWTMRVDGSEQRPITHDAATHINPAWSPDGKTIAFASDRDGSLHIWVIDPGGGDERRVTSGPGDDGSPAWSPDSRRLAFDSDRDGVRDIYVINANGTGLRRLTRNIGCNHFASWSPDGSQIAFTTNRDAGASPTCGGSWEIYTMSATGTNQTRLTHNDVFDFTAHASWSVRLAAVRSATSTTTTAAASTSTSLPSAEGPGRSAFFLRDGTADQPGPLLAPVWIQTATTPRAALDALLAGPPTRRELARLRLSTAIPQGVRVRSLQLRAGLAVVDFNATYASGGGSTSMLARLAQVVFTLTQFTGIDRVGFHVDGQAVSTFSAEGIVVAGGIGRDFFAGAGLVPRLFVERPAAGEPVSSPFFLIGTARDVGSRSFRYELTTQTEDVIGNGTVAVSAENGLVPFGQQVSFPPDSRTTLDLNVFIGDPATARLEALLQIPLLAAST